jgi:hypothetical protein
MFDLDTYNKPQSLFFRPNHRCESTRALAFGRADDFGLRQNLKPPIRKETEAGFDLA